MNKSELIAKMVAERQANSHFIFDENDYKLGLSDMYDAILLDKFNDEILKNYNENHSLDVLNKKPDEPELKLKFKYEDKLRELGVYDEFVECFKNDSHNINDMTNQLIACNSKETFKRFMEVAFVWDETPQKHKYWEEIANS